ncbi:OST-HTH/LOTUS domain-containing protein [Pantoea sp. Ap-967]|uniref:OST-HTH/LOTUS domain-containing protein n=1 Tax=Pantoea sp. Ap-967 TaxID=2608362 RepID=UPI00351BDF1B
MFTTLLFVQCLGLLGANITKLRPEFDPRTHGFKKLSDLIKGHSHAFELQARSASGGAAALYVRHKQPVK